MKETMYIIVNRLSNKYYNARENYFTSILYLATGIKTEKECEKILSHYGLKECDIIKMDYDEYLKSLASKTTEIIIIADTLARKLDAVKSNIPTIRKIDKVLTQNIKTTSNKIKASIGTLFNDFENQKEDATYDVIGVYEEYIIESSTLEMWELKEVTDMLRARRKSPESMRGIVNKILK